MLQITSKTLGFQKIMVYKTPPGGGGKPYLARGLCSSQLGQLNDHLFGKDLLIRFTVHVFKGLGGL